jgi:hypothetical protein
MHHPHTSPPVRPATRRSRSASAGPVGLPCAGKIAVPMALWRSSCYEKFRDGLLTYDKHRCHKSGLQVPSIHEGNAGRRRAGQGRGHGRPTRCRGARETEGGGGGGRRAAGTRAETGRDRSPSDHRNRHPPERGGTAAPTREGEEAASAAVIDKRKTTDYIF